MQEFKRKPENSPFYSSKTEMKKKAIYFTSTLMIKGRRSWCLISEGVVCMWERQTDRQTERWGGWERWYHISLKTSDSPISFPDRRQLGPNRQTGTLGGIFQSQRHGKRGFCYFLKFQKIASNKTHNSMFPLIVAMVRNLDDHAIFLCCLNVHST